MKIDHRLPTVQEYQTLRRFAGWHEMDNAAVACALKHSIFSVVAVESNSVVGMARVIGDKGLYFYIQDVVVHPDYQSQKIGTALMQEVMHFIKTHAGSGAFVGLMAAKGLETYYHHFGFTARDINAPGMFQVIK